MPGKNDTDLEPLLSTQQNQLNIVIAEGSNIDTKALAVLAVNVAILIFIAQATLVFEQWFIHALVLSPLTLSLLFDGLAVLPKPYSGASVNLNNHPEYVTMERAKLLLQLLADTQQAITRNRAINAVRWRYCLASIILTGIGTIALFAVL
jgi:hypothetical protein